MTKTNKKFSVVLFVALCSLLLSGICRGAENQKRKISLRLSGGVGFNDVKDINNCIKAHNDLNNDPNSFMNWSEIKNSYDFNLEVIYNLTNNFGIGLGSGYAFFNNSGEYGDKDKTQLRSEKWNWSAFPIFTNLYLSIPFNSRLTFMVKGGVGYYFSKLDGSKAIQWDDSYAGVKNIQKIEGNINATSNSFAAIAGLGADIKLIKNISLAVEGNYQFLKFKDFKGSQTVKTYLNSKLTESYQHDGYLWHAEYKDMSGNWHHDSFFQEGPISNLPWTSRRAEFDLSGFAIKVGIKYSFGTPEI